MRYLSYIFILALSVGLVACDDYLDINTNPNQPESPGDLDLLLADMTATTAYNLVGGGNWSRYGAQWMQNIANNAAPPNNDTYRINTSDCNNEWAFYSYAGVLINAKKMIEIGEEAGQEHHVGVAKILMAHNYALLADWWGDIPFSDALLRENNGRPLFDQQELVYTGIQDMLDEGIAALGKESPISLGGGDLLLGGDIAAWTRFGYALKARYYMRLTNAPGSDDQQLSTLALSAIDQAMTGAADEATFAYTSDPGQENPWNQWVVKFANTMQMSAFFVDKLETLNDPRLPIMADTSVTFGGYLGHANGGTPSNLLADISNIGAYYMDADLDIPMMTYVEQLFLKAEAHWRLGQTADAEMAYADAIRTHMEQLSGNGELGTVISDTEITDYIAANPLGGLGDLIEQKYIAGFLLSAFESYNDYRRTGFPDDIQPAQNADVPVIPTRMIYTDTEINNNAANVPAGITLESKVWWDGD
ncbi:MAG: SusD/RagB family nutrient-binding outer membrane lipoprotein [Bacteroidota bacterium]